MIITTLAALPFSASAENYSIKIGNIWLSDDKPCYINGAAAACAYTSNANVYYDFRDSTLTLNNYSGTGIYCAEDDITVNLKGKNTITQPNNYLTGLFCNNYDMEITSSTGGSLDISFSAQNTDASGITVSTILDDSPSLTVSGDAEVNVDVTTTGDYSARGISAVGNVTISDSANVNVKATAASLSMFCHGIDCDTLILNTSGNVTAQAVNSADKLQALAARDLVRTNIDTLTLKAVTTGKYSLTVENTCGLLHVEKPIYYIISNDSDQYHLIENDNTTSYTLISEKHKGPYGYNSDVHWINCTVCGVCGDTTSKGYSHVYDNDSDTTCNVCGYTRSIGQTTYTVTYKANGGTGTMAPVTGITAGTKMFLPECNFTPPSGCVFKCWSIDGVEYNAGKKITVNKNIEVLAIWASSQHTHNYATLKNDATTHWYECSCGAKSGVTSHIYDDDSDSTCNVCGYVRTIDPNHTHDYEVLRSDANDHWYECSCGARQGVESHTFVKTVSPAMFDMDGTYFYDCSVCGYGYADWDVIPAIKSIKLDKTAYVYNGKVQKPKVTVTDKKGKTISTKYYNVVYFNEKSKSVGAYKVQITMKGNYSGQKTLTYKINPKGTALSKVTTPKKQQLKVTWSKQTTQTTGYQIQYSTSSKFTAKTTKSAWVSKNKTTSTTIKKNLKSGKKYYVRIRTYNNKNNQKYYSSWSKTKSIKVK